MKILHAAETVKGGIATVIKHLTHGASQSSTNTQVKCLIPASQAHELADIPTSEIITFPATSRGLATSVSFLFSLIQAIWKYRPDVVHLHSSFAGGIGRLVLLFMRPLHRCKVVYSPHAFAFTTDIPQQKKQIYALLERMLTYITDAVVCTCQYELDIATQYKLDTSKLVLIHNGVPDPGVAASAIDTDVSTNVLQLLFVGRFDYQKGFDILLEAMRLLEGTPIHLTAIGASVHGGTAIESRPNIHYTGWVKLSELPNYYCKSHLLVMPSRWEGFAMVPLEALSNGLPVLSSSHPSFDETVIPGVTGDQFASGDAVALANKLRPIKPTALVSMREQCHLYYRQHFQVETMIQRTLALYYGLLRG